jgi:predicted methyltransferase
MKKLALAAAALVFVACAKKPEEQKSPEPSAAPAAASYPQEAKVDQLTSAEKLDAVLAAQPADEQARYPHRHPKETLQFIGVEPGMTVVEVLPGGGWWTKILLPYLGSSGKVVGADYSLAMWALFGEYAPKPEEQAKWTTTWPAGAAAWCAADCAATGAFAYGSVPAEMKGTADVVLVFRALHHFNRFEDDGGYLTAALKDTMDILKPGGIVGVEQHRAPAGNSDQWADGENGYLKQDAVIAAFKAAGFEFVGSSEVNANPKDQPTEEDMVWRLPPSLATSRDNPEMKARMEAIGESDRMTLKFRKPG